VILDAHSVWSFRRITERVPLHRSPGTRTLGGKHAQNLQRGFEMVSRLMWFISENTGWVSEGLIRAKKESEIAMHTDRVIF
jgi:hypothetical protein